MPAYSYLRDQYGTHEYIKWEKYSVYNKREIAKLVNPKSKIYDDIAVHYFIQYHLHKQLLSASVYARENGVLLKGDIPIGVNKYGIDTWIEPELFNMDEQTGAPPDDYAVDGQNWGFPTYNWEEMGKNDYQWWKKRLQKMAEYFDSYRIDHILGFFRIWEIPENAISGLLGHFSPAWAITKDELNHLNIGFNEERFCEPYITDYIYQRFGIKDAELIKEKFLDHYSDDTYKLKKEYNSQQKVRKIFDSQNGDLGGK